MVKKRSITISEMEVYSAPTPEATTVNTNKSAKTSENASKKKQSEGCYPDQEMGEFEDAFEDEVEEENVVQEDVEFSDVEGKEEEPMDEEERQPTVRAYLPGYELQEGEVLDYDASAYDMYHSMNMEWPCLSFDILRDRLGDHRTSFPMTTYFVAGSQADESDQNKVYIIKGSRLHRTKNDGDSDQENEEDDDVDDLDDDPILEHRSFRHPGGVNRIRMMRHPDVSIAATWSDTGRVLIWDMSDLVKALDVPGHKASTDLKPLHEVKHSTEGFAMDWSIRTPGRLLTGDCAHQILLTEKTQGGPWVTEKGGYQGHSGSVEDLQWSPSQDNVFASCSVDQTVKVWDTRQRKKCGMSLHAHDCDVNVISWNRKVNYLMASGADDGTFSIWDLRQTQSPAATFKWHRSAITSIEWHPSDESVLAATGADDQLTIWDFSVEQDAEEDNMDADAPDVPPQLLFIHQGQKDMKEVHWHPQMPGVLLSTAATGFNIFKSISV